jgi:hypothetical protein
MRARSIQAFHRSCSFISRKLNPLVCDKTTNRTATRLLFATKINEPEDHVLASSSCRPPSLSHCIEVDFILSAHHNYVVVPTKNGYLKNYVSATKNGSLC